MASGCSLIGIGLQHVVAASDTSGYSPHLVNVEQPADVDVRVLVGCHNLLLGQLGRHLHTHTHLHIYIHIYICIYICIHICIYIYNYRHAPSDAHMHAHAHAYAHAH